MPLNIKNKLKIFNSGVLKAYPSDGLIFRSNTVPEGTKLYSATGTDKRDLKDRYVNHLDGTTQYGSVPDNTDLDITDNVTFIIRAKNDNSALSSSDNLLTKYLATSNQREWDIGVNADEKFFFRTSSDGSLFSTEVTDDAVALENTKTYGVTFEGGTSKLYLDGVEQAITGSTAASLFNGTSALEVGAVQGSATWDGVIYETIIISGDSTVLTAAQMLDIHNSILANPTKDIQNTAYGLSGQTVAAHYKLDENTGTTFFDASGNGNDGTWQNSPTIETTTEDVINYQNQVGYSKYMYFDGVNDQIELDSTLTMTGDFRVTFSGLILSVAAGHIFGNDGDDRWFYSSSSNIVRINSTNYNFTSLSGHFNVFADWEISRVGSDITISNSNGYSSTQTTTTASFPVSSLMEVNSQYGKGVLFDFKFYNSSDTLIHQYNGYGTADSNWEDQVGSRNGTVSGSPSDILVPRDESDTANTVFGEALQESGKAKLYACLKGSSCILLDGSTQYGDLGDVPVVSHDASWEVEFDTEPNSPGTFDALYAEGDSSNGTPFFTIRTGASSTTLNVVWIDTASVTIIDQSHSGVLPNNTNSCVKVTFDGVDTLDIYVNDELLSTNAISPSSTNLNRVTLGAFGRTSYTGHYPGKLYNVKLTKAGTNTVYLPISEGGLDKSFDVSGNGNDCTFVNSPTWSTQDVYAYNGGVGFNKYLRASTAGYVAATSPSTDSIYSVKMDFYTPSDITSATSGASWFEGNNTANSFAWYFGSFTGALTNEVIGVISPGNRRTGVLNITITAGWHSVEARWNGSYYDIYLDDVMQTVTAAGAGHTLQETASDRLRFGTAAGATGFTGIMANMVVKSDSSTEIFNVLAHGEEGIADTSPNAYSLSTSGIVNQRIPKLSTADTDVFGETLRNVPVAGHNDAESTLNFKEVSDTNATIPETAHLAASTDFTAFTFDADTGWDTYDYAFYRQDSSLKNDRFLIYRADLTGDDLTKAQNYTGN